MPLSFAQERLWFLDRFDPGSTMYNIPAAARLSGDLAVPALAAAIGEIVRRHEVLRTGFAEVEGRPVQVLAPWTPLVLPLADLSGLPAAARHAELRRILEEDAVQPFDLGIPPMLRPSLLRLAEGEHVLGLDFHHIASDGWSNGVFLRELTPLYEAALAGLPSPLSPLAVQYADFAHWQREWMRGDVLLRHLDYWGRALAGAPPVLDLATDRPLSEGNGRRSAEHCFVLPAPLVADLTRLGQSEGTTLFSVLTAGLQALLSRLTGQEDLVVGSPIANRNRLETEPLIGFFVNVLALRLDLSGDPGFLDLVRRARETALGAYAHQDLPFEKLVELLATARDLDSTPVFQILFALQSSLWSGPRLGELTVETLPVPSREAKFLLNAVLIPAADGALGGTLEYRAGLFDPATMDRLAARFVAVLEAVATDPAARLSDLPLLTSEEEIQLVREWGRGLADPVRVLDGHSRPVPPGVVGDLVLEEPDGGLRPTGERARWLSTGELQVLARAVHEEGLGSERGRTAHAAPRTAVEELLAGIWMELLGVESVGLHDDFFALGGHSLLATRLLSQVRSTLGVSLPVRRLFEASTLEAQAAAVEAARAGVRMAQVPPIVPLGLEGPLPLSFAQQRLWFLEQLDPGNPTYNIPAAVRLTGPLDVAALERALGGVLARHCSLRSRFLAVEGEPAAVIEPGVELPLLVEDVPDEARVLALAREEALRPFDLATAPLVRACLLRQSEDHHVLLLTMHHIVSDGWSMGILVREVADALRRARAVAAAHPVHRLRGLAAGMDGGRGPGRRDRLVAGAAGGRSGRARAAHRPSPAAAQDLARRPAPGRAARRPRGPAARDRPALGWDPVHDSPRRPRGPLASLLPSRRGAGGLAHCQPQPGGDRAADRLLRQHPGAAGGRLGQPLFRQPAGAGTRRGHGGLRPSGPAVREGRGGRPAGPRPRPLAPVPGGLRAPEPAHPRAAAGRSGPGAGAHRRRYGEVRLGHRHGRGGRRDPGPLGLQLRPLRPGHRRARPRPALQLAGGGRGDAGRAGLGAAPAFRRRTARPGRRMDRSRRLPWRGSGA